MCFFLKKQILSQLFRTIRYKTIVFGSISLAMAPAIERTGLLNGALATASHDINSKTKTAHRSVREPNQRRRIRPTAGAWWRNPVEKTAIYKNK